MARMRLASIVILAASCTNTDDLRVDRMELASDGVPYYVRGELGRVAPQLDDAAALDGVLPAIGTMFHVAPADLVATKVQHDRIGMTHVRYQQFANGLRVVGGDLVVHVGADGIVSSVSGTARADAIPSAIAEITADRAGEAAQRATAGGAVDVTNSELTYEIKVSDRSVHLTWEVEVVGREVLLRDKVYVDAHTGEVVDRRPEVFTAKNRTIGDGHGGTYPFVDNETQVGTEAAPPTEATAKAAFDNTGATYDCYQALYQRDSWDGAGGVLHSLVHVSFFTGQGSTPNNAAWTGDQMVYGDGDGNFMSPLAFALDVTAHELTHGVTTATANLAYQDESGALNEGMSDIMGAVCEARRDGGVNANTWLVGEEIFTPATPGDALRYMNNPTLDAALYPPEFGGSRDFYSDRYQGQEDQGGVHLNSGIANLAFQLLVDGGKHPKAKTTVNVPPIGIEKAGAIFEHALTQGFFTSNTNFAEARTATEEVAGQLFPGSAKTAVSLAWAAVGVGAPPPPDTQPPTVSIVNPGDGKKVAAGFTVEVNASDETSLIKIDLSIDGVVVGSSDTSPAMFPTDANIALGDHTIVATAYDAFNQATDMVKVTVASPDDLDDGGCCSSSRNRGNPAGLIMALGVMVVVLRRRRRT